MKRVEIYGETLFKTEQQMSFPLALIIQPQLFTLKCKTQQDRRDELQRRKIDQEVITEKR